MIKDVMNRFLNRETIAYVIVGGLTTVVDFLLFALINERLKAIGIMGSNAALMAQIGSWVGALAFAYITNKLIVFRSREHSLSGLLREIFSFVAARLLSGVLVTALIWVMVDIFSANEYLAKILTSVVNVVLNYVASKLFIFTKK